MTASRTKPSTCPVMFVGKLDYDSLEAEVQKLRTELEESRKAYRQLNQHTNETEQHLDEAAWLLSEIVQSGQAYRECTDKSSATGLRVAALCDYVAQFKSEPPAVEVN